MANDPSEVAADLARLAACSSEPFTDGARAEWRAALRLYVPGECARAIRKWRATCADPGRPEPSDLAPFMDDPPVGNRWASADPERGAAGPPPGFWNDVRAMCQRPWKGVT